MYLYINICAYIYVYIYVYMADVKGIGKDTWWILTSWGLEVGKKYSGHTESVYHVYH